MKQAAITAQILRTSDERTASVESVQVGRDSREGTPDRHVVVWEAERPLLRVDVYAFRQEAHVFEAAIIWRGILIIGFGSHVHAVLLSDRSVRTFSVETYFGQFYPTPEYLLIASCGRLRRVEPDRAIAWTSAELGIDGVVVHTADQATVHGEGEWDPPGGWMPFVISARNGTSILK